MKIFDCFMFYDEEMLLDIRLNILNKFVDQFVIVESTFTHKGEKRSLKFNQKKFEKFKDKIIYLIFDKEPDGIEKIYETDNEGTKTNKYILNAAKRENGQRNYILNGLHKAEAKDLILISDVDEIPNLENIDIKNIKEKIIMFQQDMFYYKFNLKFPNIEWIGTKGCKKKYLINPQWLRNIKNRKYPFYRIDTLFSKKKYISSKIVNNGGWHFSCIKTAEEIEHKLKSFLHHREFDLEPLDKEGIKKLMENKQAIYDLRADKTVNKIGTGDKLEKYNLENLPEIIKLNLDKYKKWLD